MPNAEYPLPADIQTSFPPLNYLYPLKSLRYTSFPATLDQENARYQELSMLSDYFLFVVHYRWSFNIIIITTGSEPELDTSV